MARDGKRHRSSSPDRGGDGGSGGGREEHSKHRKYSHHRRDRDRDRDRDLRDRDRDNRRERSRSRSPDRRGRNSRSWHSSRSPSREEDHLGSGKNRDRGDNNKGGGGGGGGKWKQRSPSPDKKWLNEELTKEREQLDKQSMKALAAIQDGSKKAKRVIVKQRGKFDWENTEDTSQDMIPICHGQLLFGRGFYAGMDRREQKKQSAKIEREVKGQIGQIEAKAFKGSYDPFDDMPVDRHWSEKELHEMTARDWRIFREDYNISYKGSRFPNPARNWEESGISPELLKSVQEAGYKKPTPIQMASIPLGLQQRDVIGIAGTGSGKTAAFVIPMLTYVSKLPKMTLERAIEGPYALVMAPTTELAQQIHEETVKMARYMDINVLSLVAGESIGEQSSKLLQGCEIVIATPGRLLHCLEQGYAVLHQCNYVVLDEGDRMIALGFEEQVIDALDAMPSSNMKPESEDVELEDRIYRTTYMFSATMPPAVERLAKKYLRNPVVVTIEELSKRISQRVMMVDEEEKPKRLRRLLDELGEMSTIVFVNTKKQADKVSKQLNDLGVKVATIHGGKTQQRRQSNFQDFRSKRRSCLIATDVVGRGIDVPDVGHVVNYDMPSTVEMYIHRIGRTGRAGKSGAATTFLTLNDVEVFYDLKQLLMRTKNPVPPELARHEAAKVKVMKPAATSS